MRSNSAECFIGNADGEFRAREIRRLEPQDRWDTEAINRVIGVPWRMTDGKWTVDRPEVQADPIQIPPLPFEGARIQRERITKQDIDEFRATIGCLGWNAIAKMEQYLNHSDCMKLEMEELELLLGPEDSEVNLRHMWRNASRRSGRIFEVFSSKEKSEH